MIKGRDRGEKNRGENGEKWEKKEKNNVVAGRPPERKLPGTPTAYANSLNLKTGSAAMRSVIEPGSLAVMKRALTTKLPVSTR